MRSPTNWLTLVRKRLQQAREAAGMSQEDAGRALGLTGAAYGNFERGTTPISLEHLHNFSRVTGKPLTYLLAIDTQLTDDEQQLLEHFRRAPIPAWRRIILNTVAYLIEASKTVPESLLAGDTRAPGERE